MENININQIKSVISKYNSLSKEDKKLVDSKINEIWSEVYNEFMELCSNDAELNNLHKKINELTPVLNYNIEENFEVYAYTVNEFDPEFEEDIFEYSEEYFKESKYLAENWDKIKEQYLKKITDLKQSKFNLFKDAKIKKLEAELKEKESMVKNYNKAMSLQDKHLYLLKNKDTLYTPLVNRYNEIIKKYATQVLEKHINLTPSITCLEHTSRISSTKYDVNFDMSELNKQCNEIRDYAIKLIKEDLLNSLSK